MENHGTLKTDVLIVGAGFAGAATAYHLSHQFEGQILVVEKEARPGLHASGRNASLLFQPAAPALLRKMLVRTRHAFESYREKIHFRQHGSLLLASESDLSEDSIDPDVGSRLVSTEMVKQRIPLLDGHDFEAALWTESDGVVDIRKLLGFYLDESQARGVKLLLNCEIQALEASSPFRFQSTAGPIQAEKVINAGGAWAGSLARICEASRVPLFPLKRHLFVLEGMAINMEEGPFVWDMTENFYFRSESGGLLFCVCDEEPSTSLVPTVSPEVREQLAEVIWKHLPGLRDAVQREVWSCFRTQTSDGMFAIGWDSKLFNFFWVAGLGGSGMGASWAVGEDAAKIFMQGPGADAWMSPSRFFSGT